MKATVSWNNKCKKKSSARYLKPQRAKEDNAGKARCHVPTGVWRQKILHMYRPANDPQIVPQMIPGPEIAASPWIMKVSGLRNLDSGFNPFFLNNTTDSSNKTVTIRNEAKWTVFEQFECKFHNFKNDTAASRITMNSSVQQNNLVI